MLRLCYILLFTLLALALDKGSADSSVASDESMHGQHYAEQWICCRECNSDMLRTRSEASCSLQNNSSAHQQVRSRVVQAHKVFSMATPTRRAGHVTQIFEFDRFRSSHRIVYYLHALCRLRI